MPAPAVNDPSSLRSRIRAYLAEHPDSTFRPTEVSRALPVEPGMRRQVASELGRLHRQGLVGRMRNEDAAAHGPGVRYFHLAVVEQVEGSSDG